MTTLQSIIAKLEADERFYFLKGNNKGFYRTFPPGGESKWIDFKKPLAGTTGGEVLITLLAYTDHGVEMTVRVKNHMTYAPEGDTFFEGFVENESDFDRLMVMLGIN